jgi:hypothetical protein
MAAPFHDVPCFCCAPEQQSQPHGRPSAPNSSRAARQVIHRRAFPHTNNSARAAASGSDNDDAIVTMPDSVEARLAVILAQLVFRHGYAFKDVIRPPKNAPTLLRLFPA